MALSASVGLSGVSGGIGTDQKCLEGIGASSVGLSGRS